ncbi:ABC transporter ATP-binding protein [Salisediminibacterium halotolerans]|uniref:ABC transporter ATP-binding protein n=1 Tax=Salisediminibacterium halotolerans TaxID=517425 RepID=UPI000EB40C43|nr:ABC transporter ATP-binding protein [Salisediminibacterium halotolerans]RLJ79333.1 peptide/nickel transport system ATP-binding protein/oligopeptide transport system ATP-binding protein [Actinophytocola xinjiangensis]RPE83417.1 peptide/nickel transport system ATP-binding protein/oligopeptide transport system ATP-binding protein [Salisediminibacterium halotolerans]TWG37775.1 peptide/nickel transport system ATP-binding protein/oligopeptide transport system ATP-binding protein [Salisediminibacter
MSKETLLEVEDLHTYFYLGDKVAKAVDGVDFNVHKGETVAIVGESGSGKSITSLSIMRLIPQPPGKIVSGSVKLEGRDLLALSDKEMTNVRGDDIAMIFQEPMTSLNPVYTVGEQIAEMLLRHKKVKTKKEGKAKAVELLQQVGFPRAEETVKEHPHQLSGGMRQRVMIAMAMSCDPKLLIADEPTTALDVTIQAQILELMQSVKEKYHSSILMITHDLGVVAEMADRILVMYGGQIVENTSKYKLFTDAKHPYTEGLLASMPTIEEDKERLESISGTVPPADNFPQGCRFAPRCQYAMEACTKEVPALREVEPGHYVRCILYDENQGGTAHDS